MLEVKAVLVDAHVNENHTLYEINVTCRCEQWCVFRRFSWFVQLDKEISNLFPEFVHLRASVGPTWLRRSTSPQVVEERKESLNSYIARILTLPLEISLSQPVCRFLRIGDELRTALLASSGRPDDHLPCMDDLVCARSELVTPDGLVDTPPPIDDQAVVEWLLQITDRNSRDPVIKSELRKMGNGGIQIFFESLFSQIGERRHDENTSVSAVDKLLLLQSLVCVETNIDAGPLVSVLRDMDMSRAHLADFITHPTIASTKSSVYKILRSLGNAATVLSESNGGDYALNQYLAWLALENGFTACNPDPSWSATSQLSQTGLAGVFALGPNSPSARSVGPFSPTASMGRSHLASLLANEAREWVSFAVSSERDFYIAGSVATESWREVPVPVSLEKDLVGKVSLKYRKSTSGSGEIEIKLRWAFPASTDMESVVNLVYDPATYLDSLSGVPERIRDFAISYFGFVSLTKHRSTDQAATGTQGSCTPAMSCMSVGANVLAKSTLCHFTDMRRIGGSAIASILRSCAKSFSGNIIIASCCDPSGLPSVTDPLVRPIRHLHFTGCEIDIAKGLVSGSALLSPESVFLVASDLLGEPVLLWKSLVNFSNVLKSVALSSQSILTPVSQWLASMDASAAREDSFS